MCFFFLWKRYPHYFKTLTFKGLLKLKAYGNFLKVSSDIFIRTLCVIAVFTFFTSVSARMGNDVLAANSILIQFLFLFSYFLDGFAYAAEAIIGRIGGSRNRSNLPKAVRRLFLWGGGFALLFSLSYLFFDHQILGFMTNQSLTIKAADDYYIWVLFIPLASFATFIWDGIYIGATASKAMRNTMLISAIAFYFIPFFALYYWFGNHALWLSMILFMLSRGVLQTAIAKKVVFNRV